MPFTDTYKAFLYISGNKVAPLKIDIGQFNFINDKIQHSDYQAKPELFHTFKQEPALAKPLFPVVFSLLTIAPWIVLLGMVNIMFM